MEYFKSFTYTAGERRRLFFVSRCVIKLSLPISLIVVVISFIVEYDQGKIAADSIIPFTIFTTAAFTVLLIPFLVDFPCVIASLKAEQKIYIYGNVFYYECGDNVLSVETKYIAKIKRTKRDYVIKLLIDFGTGSKEAKKFIIYPHIPKRIIQDYEIEHFVSLLGVPNKQSIF